MITPKSFTMSMSPLVERFPRHAKLLHIAFLGVTAWLTRFTDSLTFNKTNSISSFPLQLSLAKARSTLLNCSTLINGAPSKIAVQHNTESVSFSYSLCSPHLSCYVTHLKDVQIVCANIMWISLCTNKLLTWKTSCRYFSTSTVVTLFSFSFLCVDEPKPSHDSCPALKVSVDAEMMQLVRQTDEEFAGEQTKIKFCRRCQLSPSGIRVVFNEQTLNEKATQSQARTGIKTKEGMKKRTLQESKLKKKKEANEMMRRNKKIIENRFTFGSLSSWILFDSYFILLGWIEWREHLCTGHYSGTGFNDILHSFQGDFSISRT